MLFDSNIMLYFLGGDKTLIPLLEEKQLYISFITQLEVLGYKDIKEKELTKVKDFIRQCIVIDVNSDIKENTIRIRRNYGLKLPDCIILATAMYMNIPLISADREYRKVKDIELIFYEN